ncbi:MAG: GatB/YqeY domain-containing protein [Patescibacteria group bacterium]
MSLFDSLQTDLRNAMKQGEVEARDALRLLLSYIKNAAKDIKKAESELEDAEVVAVIKKEIKKRKDSIKAFIDGGREELAEKEQREVVFFEQYMPEEMPVEKIDEVVKKVVDGLGDKSTVQFGQAMGAVMKEIGPDADGGVVKERLQAYLSS